MVNLGSVVLFILLEVSRSMVVCARMWVIGFSSDCGHSTGADWFVQQMQDSLASCSLHLVPLMKSNQIRFGLKRMYINFVGPRQVWLDLSSTIPLPPRVQFYDVVLHDMSASDATWIAECCSQVAG